jgi:hypothetical protein
MLNFNGRIKNTPNNQQPVQSTHSKKQEEPITATSQLSTIVESSLKYQL